MQHSGLDGSHHAAVVVGAGQAGLAVSWWLAERGVESEGHIGILVPDAGEDVRGERPPGIDRAEPAAPSQRAP